VKQTPGDALDGPPAVALRGVVKRFGSHTAIDHLDLEIPRGVCFGLLGPNGAGKSTTMRTLTGQAQADEGTVEVLGCSMPADSKAIRARCGVVPQVDNLDDELTVAENLEVAARLYGLRGAARAQAIVHGLELARLVDRADAIADELSGGMRRRLLIARGLVHRPELVLLDEPTVGLDPQIRQQLWAQIDTVRSQGATVVLTSHYIEEAERLCDEVAIVHRGRIVAQGSPRQLIADTVGGEVGEVWGPARELAEVARLAAAAGLETRDAGTSIVVFGVDRIARGQGAADRVAAPASGAPAGGAPASGADAGDAGRLGALVAALAGGRRRDPTLEDVFVVLTGEELT
jgi:lipooligosaccharide transport system ATP-binding protein